MAGNQAVIIKASTSTTTTTVPTTFTLSINGFQVVAGLIQVTPSVGDTVSINPAPGSGGTYAIGTSITLTFTAAAASGFTFTGWGGACSGTGNCVLTMDGNKTVTTAFTPPPTAIQPPAGMVSWWPGDGNANDIVYGNNGTLQGGATFAPGKVGQAFSFDGVSGMLSVPNTATLGMTAAYTFDAWVKHVPNGTDQVIAVRSNTDFSAHDIEFKINGNGGFNTLGVSHNRSNGGTPSANPFPVPPLNILFHLAVVYDGTKMHAYYNGVEQSSTDGDGTIGAPLYTNRGWVFGRTDHPSYGGQGKFNGIMDEIELFNRALSATEIQAIYNAGSAGKVKPTAIQPPAGLVSWWPGDGNASDIQDGNNGTLMNGATFAAGKVGQAFSFDGVDDFVQVPHNSNLDPGTGSFTVDAWIKTAKATDVQVVVRKYECSGFCGSTIPGIPNSLSTFQLTVNDGRLSAFLRDADGPVLPGEGQYLTGAKFIADGNFHHTTMVRDLAAGEFRLYVDGTLDASAPLNAGATGAITDGDGEPDPFLIGAGIIGGLTTAISFFSGLIDEVSLFNRALSAAEIAAIYNAGSAGKVKL